MGDPAGIGPEICLDLLADQEIQELCTPIIFGDLAVIKSCAEKTGKPSHFQAIKKENLDSNDSPVVLDLDLMNLT